MGSDKARILWKGRTFVSHLRTAATELGLPVRTVRRDLVQKCGPLGGIATGLKTSKKSAVLFLACDAPLISAEILQRVIGDPERLNRSRFTSQGRGLGFPMLIPKAGLPLVLGNISAGLLSIQQLGRTLTAVRVRIPKPLQPLLANINTPQDLENLRNGFTGEFVPDKTTASRPARSARF